MATATSQGPIAQQSELRESSMQHYTEMRHIDDQDRAPQNNRYRNYTKQRYPNFPRESSRSSWRVGGTPSKFQNDFTYNSQSSWTRQPNHNSRNQLSHKSDYFNNDHHRSQDRSAPLVNGSFMKNESKQSWKYRSGRNQYAENPHEVFDDSESRISAGINFQSYDAIPVDLSGPKSELIQPFKSFDDAPNFHPQLQQNISSLDYKNPTPVQKYSIPVLLDGHDLMACAQTGSGKTAAFLCPIISKMLTTGPPNTEHRNVSTGSFRPAFPVALILSPTRELAVQIFKEARKFAYNTGIITHVVYGGSPYRDQVKSISRCGTDICVATPGRLLELIDRGALNLKSVYYLVLDEADRMLDMGFSPQINAIVNNHGMLTSAQGRQTIMLSATFPAPIQKLARQFLKDFMFLTVGRVGSTNEFIRQQFIYANESNKPQLLIRVLRDCPQGLILIFVETRKKADIIETFLQNLGFNTVCLHGDKTQIERENALALFRSGRSPILVATDVAARGLDINHVEHVVNCDLPARIEDYVHRIGRTGRAGNYGKATSFVNEQNKPILKDLLSLLQESQQDVPSWLHELIKSCQSTPFHQQSYYGSHHQNYRKPNRNHHTSSDASYNRFPKPSHDDEEDGW